MLRSTIHAGTMLMSIVPVAAGYYRQRNTCCSGIDDSRLISDNEKHQRLSNPSQTKEKVYLDRKPLRRALKKYNKDADIQLFIAVGFWRGKGRGSVVLKRTLEVWLYTNENMGKTWRIWGVRQGWEDGHQRNEKWVSSGCIILKIPNNQ